MWEAKWTTISIETRGEAFLELGSQWELKYRQNDDYYRLTIDLLSILYVYIVYVLPRIHKIMANIWKKDPATMPKNVNESTFESLETRSLNQIWWRITNNFSLKKEDLYISSTYICPNSMRSALD